MKRILLQTSVLCLCVFFAISAASAQGILLADATNNSQKAVKNINKDGLLKLIEQNKGKIVLVNFFATWCPPCKEEIPGLVSIAEKRSKDVVIVGLSFDKNPALLPDFIKEYKMQYDVFLADAEIQELFGVTSIPHNAVFDKNGENVANEGGYVSEKELNKFFDTLLEKK